MARSFLPTADGELLSWANNFFARVDGSAGDYGLSDPQIAQFEAKRDAYAAAYQKAFDPVTRTRPVITEKDAKKAALASYARECVRLVQATPGVTDAQRRDLKITVAKKRAPVPAPTARPAVELAGVSVRTVTVNVFDPASSTKRSKVAGAIGAKLYTFVGAGYPSDPSLWAYQGDFTKAKCEIVFPDSVPGGAQVWVCAAWYNRKGEAGPASVPLTTNLQGGGSQQETATIRLAA